jgi:hypothetical protein
LLVQRARTYALILGAAFVTVLLATSLLAVAPVYTDAVYLASARRTLQDTPQTVANVEVTAQVRPQAYASLDAVVVRETQALTVAGGSIVRSAISDSFALPGQETVSELAQFRFSEGLERHATVLEGSWPEGSALPLQVALSDTAAARLGLEVGAALELSNRVDRISIPITLVGIFRVDAPEAAYWYSDPLWIDGAVEGQSFTTHGPFVITQPAFFEHFSRRPMRMAWRVFPAFEEVTVERLPELRNASAGLAARVNASRGDTPEVTVTTGLPEVVSAIERSLLATRSSVLVLTIQLAVLAGYALLLTAGLLVEQRGVETALLRSRGAGVRQIVTLALMEGLLLVGPAVLAGPWVAALSLRLLNRFGPLAEIGLTLEPLVTRDAYLLALLAGLACLVALSLPALSSARSILDVQAERGRQRGAGIWRRGGLDLALVVVAGVGLLQLRRYASPLTESVRGRLEVDPLLVAAPTLGLLAGAVIALRLLPWAGHGVERLAQRGRRLTPALGAWQIARRPLRYTRAALLLVLAVSIGAFALAYTDTWQTSQHDQAGFQTGADIRAWPDARRAAIPRHVLASAHLSIDGVRDSMPVESFRREVSRSVGSVDIVLLDSDRAARIVAFRDDLADTSFGELMQQLSMARPYVASVPLPGEPRRIALDTWLTVEGLCPEDHDPSAPPVVIAGEPFSCTNPNFLGPEEQAQLRAAFTLFVVVRDGDGVTYRLPAGPLDVIEPGQAGAVTRTVVDLTTTLPDGTLLTPRYPLDIVALELDSMSPGHRERNGRLEVHGLFASDLPSGEDWTSAPFPEGNAAWTSSASRFISTNGVSPRTQPGQRRADELLALHFNTGLSYWLGGLPVTFTLRPAGSDPTDALPVLVSEHLMEQAALAVGDTFRADIGGGERNLLVTGVIDTFPTLSPVSPVIIVADLETLAAQQLNEPDTSLTVARMHWLAVDDAHALAATETLRQSPYSSRQVESRVGRTHLMQTDPIALGTIGALAIGFLAAGIFAVVGFIVSATVSARERLTEFALLRALGLSPRQLAGWLLLENGFLVLISLLAGTLLGVALSWLILPLISVTQQATAAFPGVIVVIPWGGIALLQLTLVGTLIALSAILTATLRHRGLGRALRIGED